MKPISHMPSLEFQVVPWFQGDASQKDPYICRSWQWRRSNVHCTASRGRPNAKTKRGNRRRSKSPPVSGRVTLVSLFLFVHCCFTIILHYPYCHESDIPCCAKRIIYRQNGSERYAKWNWERTLHWEASQSHGRPSPVSVETVRTWWFPVLRSIRVVTRRLEKYLKVHLPQLFTPLYQKSDTNV